MSPDVPLVLVPSPRHSTVRRSTSGLRDYIRRQCRRDTSSANSNRCAAPIPLHPYLRDQPRIQPGFVAILFDRYLGSPFVLLQLFRFSCIDHPFLVCTARVSHGCSRFCSDLQAPAAFTLADLDDRLVQAVSSTWDKYKWSPPSLSITLTIPSSICRK